MISIILLKVCYYLCSFCSGNSLTITDNPKGSVVKSVTDIPEWGKNSQWVINATTLSNNQQYSGPSTTAYSYSNPNFSTEAGQASSTPASSNADLLSRNTEGGGHFRCNVQGCDDRRVFTEEIHLRRHQEIKHADLFQPKITYACGAIECRTRRYATIERLQSHINCTHPETLESPAQLPASEISWRDTQPDRRAQVNNFIAGQYLAGMEENPSTIPRQKARGEARPLAIDNRIQGKGSRRSQQQMVHRKTSMRGSVSTMQRQLSARSADDSAGKPLGPLNTASSNHRIGSTVINSNAFFQNPALQARLTVDQMDDFNVQHGVLQSYPHRTNSPTPSLIDRFGHNMQISNQSNLPQTCSEIGEETMDPAVLRERHGMYVTNTAPLPTSAAFVVNLDPEKQPMMPFNPRSINPYVNLEHTETGVIFQPGYNGTGMEVPAWSGQGSSSPAGQINFLNGTYAPLGFQFNNQNNHYPVNDSSSPNFPVTPSTTKQPMLMLNDGTMLNTSHGANFNYAPNTRKIDPVLSQQESLPRLEYSTMSSSGASESIISPVDDPNPYSNNFGDDLDLASCFFNEFNNVDMVGHPRCPTARHSSTDVMFSAEYE